MNILQLSDIHFGRERYVTGEPFSRREEIQQKLLECVGNLPAFMKIDIIVITGDVAWYGKKRDYLEAIVWLRELLKVLNLDGRALVICPGNHDVNRSAGLSFKKSDILDGNGYIKVEKVDELFQYDRILEFEPLFYNYNQFCDELGVIPYQFPGNGEDRIYSYTCGYRMISCGNKEVVFNSFNTAMLSFDSGLKEDQMFLGQPQIDDLRNSGILNHDKTNYRIGLFHHAERFLHPNEQCEYDDREATITKLLDNMDLSLCGHTETGGVPVLRRNEESGKLLTAGATYYNDIHPNSFSVIHLDETSWEMSFAPFHWNQENWIPFHPIGEYENWGVSSGNWISEPIQKKYNMVFAFGEDKFRIPYRSPQVSIIPSPDGTGLDYRMNTADAPGNFFIMDHEVINNVEIPRIKITKRYYSFVEARVILENFDAFVIKHLGEKGWSWHEAVGEEENKCLVKEFYYTERSSGFSEGRNRLFNDLYKIEKAFDVLFCIPNIDQEWCRQNQYTIYFLKEIAEHGFCDCGRDIEKACYFTNEQKTLAQFLNMAELKVPVTLKYEQHVVMTFMGATFPLNKCIQYYKNMYVTNASQLRKQVRFFVPGDTYHVEFEGGNETEDIFVVRDFADAINPDWRTSIETQRVITIPMVEPEPLEKHMSGFLPLPSMTFVKT